MQTAPINCDILTTCVMNRTCSVHHQCLGSLIAEDCGSNEIAYLVSCEILQSQVEANSDPGTPTTSGTVRGFWE